MSNSSSSAIDLYWLPLGAGGHFVRMNGRVYETLAAWCDKRARYEIYHSAMVITLPVGKFVIEQAWPIPRGDRNLRGVVSEGPVGTRLARFARFLCYEIRRWPDGVISDIDEAVSSPVCLSRDVVIAARILELIAEAPTPVWGRDELHAGEMWNSNSLISWLIARSGLDVDAVQPPLGGRAPGWYAGIVVARRQQETLRRETRFGAPYRNLEVAVHEPARSTVSSTAVGRSRSIPTAGESRARRARAMPAAAKTATEDVR